MKQLLKFQPHSMLYAHIAGIESTIHSVLEEKRNILVVGESPIILMGREEEERSSQTESDLHDIESLDDNN